MDECTSLSIIKQIEERFEIDLNKAYQTMALLSNKVETFYAPQLSSLTATIQAIAASLQKLSLQQSISGTQIASIADYAINQLQESITSPTQKDSLQIADLLNSNKYSISMPIRSAQKPGSKKDSKSPMKMDSRCMVIISANNNQRYR